MSVIGHSPLAGASGAAGGGDPLYVDDVFSTFVYDGTGSARSINNGIDLSGEGGLVWIKRRDSSANHRLGDTERGTTKYLISNQNIAETTNTNIITSYNNNGFDLSTHTQVNGASGTYASWTFRKAPKFFDVVTYSGTGSVQNISHSLGSVPGMIMIHCRDGTHDWEVYHRSTGATKSLHINKADAQATDSTVWNNTTPTSSVFTVGTSSNVNQNGHGYVAYVFAHDEQSFGTDSDESIIKCGSFTTNGSSSATIDLGFEPQWLIYKRSDGGSEPWQMLDVMRGWSVITSGAIELHANTASAEAANNGNKPTSSGFLLDGGHSNNATYVYMAIRRPHKPPTAGTEVFTTKLWTGNAASNRTITGVGFSPDLVFGDHRGSAYGVTYYDRLRGKGKPLTSSSAGSEGYTRNEGGLGQDSFDIDGSYGLWNNNGLSYVGWLMRRAPGFMDVVAYTGTGGVMTINHNLEVAPEIIWIKARSSNMVWSGYDAVNGPTKYMVPYTDSAALTSSVFWNNTAPTSTQFTTGNGYALTGSGEKFVAFLFASLDGISKISSYTGTGNNINVDCGFTAGARWILIKRTDSSADWYVWDTTRGIVSGNDPYLLLNSTAAEVTNTDYIDPLNAGFTVTSSAPAALNASGGTYLFLAIA